ncbi:MAG: MG2 domain-containing protein [Flammeovirgaceae bacterium]
MKKFIYSLLTFFFLLNACQKDSSQNLNEIVKNYEKFSGHISAFTSGTISKAAAIKIRLASPIKPDIEANTFIAEKLFDFEPAIEGSAFWIDNQTISFQPSSKLPSGKEFKGVFYLGKLKEVDEPLKKFEFVVKTYQQYIDFDFKGLEAYDTKDFRWQKIKGSLNLVDVEDNETLEKAITAIQNGKLMPIKWQHDAEGLRHSFYIDSVQRTEQPSTVTLELNGELIGLSQKESKVIDIPAINDFKILNVSVLSLPSQHILVNFSDPIDNSQNLNGLIRLLNGANVRYTVVGNELKIYPTNRQTGNTELVINGIRNSLGYAIAQEAKYPIEFEEAKPSLRTIGHGVIMPSSKGLNFPFMAVNLSAVKVKIVKIYEKNIIQFFQINHLDGMSELGRVGDIVYKGEVKLQPEKPIDFGEWNTFSIDLSKYIAAEPGAMYRVMLSFDKKHSLYNCGEEKEKTKDDELQEITTPDDDDWYDRNNQYEQYDDYYNYYDYDSEEYDYEQRDNPCHPTYYRQYERKISRNILASDLGIIAKGSRLGEYTFAVTDLKTTDYLSSVKLELYDYQQQLLASASTDGEGLAKIKLNKKPYLLIASKDQQKGYLRLDDGSSLSLSSFDVSGQETKKGIKGYIYGERGVWRPGDSLHLSFVLEDKQNVIPDNHPVIFELYNPSNQMISKKVSNNHVGGVYYFGTATDENAMTGDWTAKVRVGGAVFTKYLKIETVKPNRLKIKLDFEELITAESNVSGVLKAMWLHGAKADGLRAEVKATLNQTQTSFKGFENYNFDNPVGSFYAEAQNVFEGNLNAEGEASISPELSVENSAPKGMLKAIFTTRVFEESGDFSIDQFAVNYSPYKSYVGIIAPVGTGWAGSLNSAQSHQFQLATVNEKGKPISKNNLTVKVYRLNWRWWWESTGDEYLADYINNETQYLIKSMTASTSNGKGTFDLKVDDDEYGRVLVMVTDEESGHTTGEIVYVSSWGGESKIPGGATMLTFSTDKNKYNVGDKIKVNFPSGGVGKALISIETSSKVLQSFWAEAKEKNTTVEFEATPEMSPNCYVNISLIQPHNVAVNDAPLRMYGVQSVEVEDPNTHLYPVLEMPNELAPEKKFTIKISEKESKAMSYTIAIVDEGLLDLTRFKTPDPWRTFYAKEALGVKTWDYYDKVMGAYAGEIAGLLQIGGDEAAINNKKESVNRFKPLVKFLGPFMLEKGKTHSHQVILPNYVGSVRTMVVASYEGAYGSTEKTTPVKKPLMVLATLPRVLSPDESLTLPVTVFAMEKRIKDVSIEIQPNELLIPVGATRQQLTFDEIGEQIANFELRVAPIVGKGKLKVKAKSGTEEAYHEIEINVRNPNPVVTETQDAILEGGNSWTQSFRAIGIEGTNTAVLEISSVPPLNLEKRLKYLIQYPHGCVEQTTSSVFPQLYVSNLMELTPEEKSRIEENIKAGIQRLRKFQTPEGGLSYWPGENYISDWGTNYAGHFMIEAQKAGYHLPEGFLTSWIRYQKTQASNWTRYYYYDDLEQAYRLYTLALANAPELGAMNRLRESPKLPDASKWVLAAAYQMVGQPEVSKSLIKGLTLDIPTYKEYDYTYGSDLRDEAMILETLSLMGMKNEAKQIVKQISSSLNSNNWYSTQTTAYCLLAINKFIGMSKDGNKINVSLTINGKTQNISTDKPLAKVNIPFEKSLNGNVSLINKGTGNTLFVKLVMTGIPLMSDSRDSESNLKMTVRYLDSRGISLDPSSITQGSDLIAEVTVSNPSRTHYSNMALTQIFPSGWEIQAANARLGDYESADKNSSFDYQDIRDDRVNTYFSLSNGESKVFRIRLNAAYLGSYYLPTTYCEAMYDNEVNARKAGGRVNVVNAGM